MSSKVKSSASTDGGSPLVPKRRFPEFQDSDGWQETSLQKLARPVTNRATTGDADRVLSLSGEHGLVLQSDYFGKKIAGDITDRYLKIRKDDFVYNDRTTKASSFGTIKRLSNYPSGIVSPIYKCFRFQPKENPIFWEWYFESGSHDQALGGLVNEGARAGRFNISVTQFLSTNARRPDGHEQQKIADCLDSVDALIEAQARKVDALRAHKKGLMQKLFPQEGETQPRLRFPEFQGSGDWLEGPINSCLTRVIDYRGKAPPKSESGIPLITAKNVRLGWLDMSNDEYIDADQYHSWMSRGIPREGDVLFTTEAPLGNVALFPRAGKFAVGQRLLTLRSNPKKCLSDFLFQSLLGPGMQGNIHYHSTGSTAKGIKSSVFVNIPIIYPDDIGEQQRIADCLTSLDDLIAAEARKLDTLKPHKKGLMQQLFPQVGEE
jgi:type I restriction enzyme S subunit